MDIRSELVAFLPRLRRFALTLCRDPAQVDPLVAKSCKQAVEKARSWKGDTRLEVRLFALVRAAALPDMQKSRHGDRDTAPKTMHPLTARPLIGNVPADHAATYLLCAVEGLSYRETAAVMGTTDEAIGQVMLAVRREIRDRMVESNERSA